jgi:GGDEF domain-containing protein
LAFAASKLRQLVRLNVSASIGVTLYPQDNMMQTNMRHADRFRRILKELGKNRYHLFDMGSR